MIKRSLLWAVGLVLAYTLLLAAPGINGCFTTQSLRQDNLIRSQHYVMADPAPPYAIVGTSLSRRLDKAALGESFHNLACSGGSLFTGIEIVLRSGQQPHAVLIETNLLLQDEEPTFLDNVFRPVFASLRPILPSFQERFQPTNLLGWMVGEQALPAALTHAGLPVATANDRLLLPPSEQQFRLSLAEKQRVYRNPYPLERVRKNVGKLREKVSELEARGIRCVFLEMPLDRAITHTPKIVQMRQSLQEAFPPTRHRWITPDRDRNYATTDGIHLIGAEATPYAHFVRSQIESWFDATVAHHPPLGQ